MSYSYTYGYIHIHAYIYTYIHRYIHISIYTSLGDLKKHGTLPILWRTMDDHISI